MERNEMPVGFAMALAMNPEAMQKFAALSETEKQVILAGTHTVRYSDEMQRYVNALVTDQRCIL